MWEAKSWSGYSSSSLARFTLSSPPSSMIFTFWNTIPLSIGALTTAIHFMRDLKSCSTWVSILSSRLGQGRQLWARLIHSALHHSLKSSSRQTLMSSGVISSGSFFSSLVKTFSSTQGTKTDWPTGLTLKRLSTLSNSFWLSDSGSIGR